MENANEHEWTRMDIVMIDKGNLGGSYSVEAGSTFWFNDAILLNQVSTKGTSVQRVDL